MKVIILISIIFELVKTKHLEIDPIVGYVGWDNKILDTPEQAIADLNAGMLIHSGGNYCILNGTDVSAGHWTINGKIPYRTECFHATHEWYGSGVLLALPKPCKSGSEQTVKFINSYDLHIWYICIELVPNEPPASTTCPNGGPKRVGDPFSTLICPFSCNKPSQTNVGHCQSYKCGGTSTVHYYTCCNLCVNDSKPAPYTYHTASTGLYCGECSENCGYGCADGEEFECGNPAYCDTECKKYSPNVFGFCWMYTHCFNKCCKHGTIPDYRNMLCVSCTMEDLTYLHKRSVDDDNLILSKIANFQSNIFEREFSKILNINNSWITSAQLQYANATHMIVTFTILRDNNTIEKLTNLKNVNIKTLNMKIESIDINPLHEPRIPEPESQILEPEFESQIPEFGSQIPEPESQILEPESQIPEPEFN